MIEELNQLRQQIDQTDQKLLQLLQQRLALVKQVGEVKHQYGLPIYAPEREAQMLQARRQEAENMGLSSDLIEDILRRVMRESYVRENQLGFKTTNPAIGKIVIVGGKGKLGGLFARYLQASGYKVAILDKEDWSSAVQILENADTVIISVPIAQTLSTIEQLAPFLQPTMLLADLTSVKQASVEKMLQVHQGAVVGLHPMFAADITSMAKQVVVCCEGRWQEKAQWLLDQIQLWGAKIHYTTPFEHDKSMTYIQALRHFSTFVAGLHLSHQPVELANLLALSSPIYRLELAMIGRLFAQDAELYADIIGDKVENLAVIEELCQCYQQCLSLFLKGDREAFIQQFSEVKQWFGDYASLFLKESQQLLQQAQDTRVV